MQASSYPKEGKPVSSYLSYIIPSIYFDGSNSSKNQHDHKATHSSSSGYNYQNFEYQDVPYVDCDPAACNSTDLTKDEIINEDRTSTRNSSSCSSEVYEEANGHTPNNLKRSPINLSDDSTFISPELHEFFESCLPNIVKGRQWVLLYR